MTQKKASIFLHSVTLIDCAYIDSSGSPVGMSIEPVFIISGAVDTPEQVVIDFSKVKKLIKELIDHKETGFDHKLWIDPDDDAIKAIGPEGEDHTYVETSCMTITCPTNGLRMISGLNKTANNNPEVEEGDVFLENIEAAISDYLSQELAYLGVVVEVAVPVPAHTDIDAFSNYLGCEEVVTEMFDYTHGLPNSSSWGCQMIVHGHSSFVLLGRTTDKHPKDLGELTERIAAYLHDSYLYNEADATSIRTADGFHYSYTTERGNFKISLNNEVDVVGMLCAPTIENIVDHCARKFAADLDQYGVSCLAISEGLLKGAVLKSNSWKLR